VEHWNVGAISFGLLPGPADQRLAGKLYLQVALWGSGGVYDDITASKQAEEEIIRQREELRGLAVRLAEAEESERQQLARELHDQVCQNLSSIGLTLETLKLRAQQEPLDRWYPTSMLPPTWWKRPPVLPGT
jgi:signal transduction histidine kinase